MRSQDKSAGPTKITVGSVTVKVYFTPTRGNDGYTVAWHEGTRRERRMFGNLKRAKEEARLVAERLNAGRGLNLTLTGADRDSYLYAIGKLKPLAVGLAPAVDEYVAAKGEGVPLLPAAQFYRKSHVQGLPSKTVTETVEELLAAKKHDGASSTYLAPLKTCLTRFSRDFAASIADVQTQDIDAWLRALKLSPRSRNNHRNAVVLLFNFAKKAGYLNRDLTTAAEHTSLARAKKKTPPFYLPIDFAKLLATATPDLLPSLVLGGFCGLRAVEIARLDWSAIHWEESNIIISIEASKQAEAARRRIAPLTPPAAAWLANYRTKKGKVLPLDASDFYAALKPVFSKTEVSPKYNGLRHSFITYRVAMTKDFVKTAYEAGSSVAKIQSNYDAVATEAEGKLWFSIMPERAENVLAITAA
jgi:integrase